LHIDRGFFLQLLIVFFSICFSETMKNDNHDHKGQQIGTIIMPPQWMLSKLQIHWNPLQCLNASHPLTERSYLEMGSRPF
jgi:hypothetical protein